MDSAEFPVDTGIPEIKANWPACAWICRASGLGGVK